MPSPTVEQLAEGLTALDSDLGDLRVRVARLEGMTEVVAGVRADIAAIVEGIDPDLVRHVAELDARLDRHDLLLGRLLDDRTGQ